MLNRQLLLIIFMLWITYSVQSWWTWGYGPHFEELWPETTSVSAVNFLLVKFASGTCTAAGTNRRCCAKLESFHNIFNTVVVLTGRILVLKLFRCLWISWKSISVVWHKPNLSCVICALRMAWESAEINRLSVLASFSLYS